MNAETNLETLEDFNHWEDDPAVLFNRNADADLWKTTLYQAILQAFGSENRLNVDRFSGQTGFFLAAYLETGWKVYEVWRPNASILSPTMFTKDWREDEQHIASASPRQVWSYLWECNYKTHTQSVNFSKISSVYNTE